MSDPRVTWEDLCGYSLALYSVAEDGRRCRDHGERDCTLLLHRAGAPLQCAVCGEPIPSVEMLEKGQGA